MDPICSADARRALIKRPGGARKHRLKLASGPLAVEQGPVAGEILRESSSAGYLGDTGLQTRRSDAPSSGRKRRREKKHKVASCI